MKRIGFITDDINTDEPLSNIFREFAKGEVFQVETFNRLNPALPTLNKIRSIIEISDVVVFFISKGSPNIYYEIGLAQGASKKVVLIANSYELIPIELTYQKCIITCGRNFDQVGYEIYESVKRALQNRQVSFEKFEHEPIYESFFTDYVPNLQFRDLYAFTGSKRGKLFEQWFIGLARNVKHWEVIGSGYSKSKDSLDFMIWNSTEDLELQALGNPIPVELKSLNANNFSQWNATASKLKKQGLRSLILLTTGINKTNASSFSIKMKREHGVLIIALDRDNLIDIHTPRDLYFSIKEQLLKIMFEGG